MCVSRECVCVCVRPVCVCVRPVCVFSAVVFLREYAFLCLFLGAFPKLRKATIRLRTHQQCRVLSGFNQILIS